MALLTAVQSKITGTVTTKSAADVAGETFKPGNVALHVLNGSASSITVTVAVPGNTRYGQDEPDIAVPIAAGVETDIGPFPSDLADPADGLVHVTYSAVTTVTRRLVRL